MSVETVSMAQQAEWLPDPAAPSWQSRCLVGLLRLLPIKKRLASGAAVQQQVRAMALRPMCYEPAGLGRGIEVERMESAAGWPVYETATAAARGNARHVVFLHGGGFFREIVRAHWRFVAYLNREAVVRCIVPIYPLTPGSTARDLVPATGELLRELMDRVGAENVTVVGNSAGAALGLAAAQWIRDAGHEQPRALVLISPGGDFSVSRPEQIAIAARDPLQDIPGVREAGRMYAGELDASHPYVCPLNASFERLPPMTIFSGTLDLFYPDCIDMAAKARAAGVPVDLHLRQGQPHNYAAMPTPEGREARAAILRVLAEDR
ncbi:alpha/beta fold hydrolase [Massilia endophytica]|uniref:alpha/beta fold hydrolase n=1 Tax=Massilia endophytica TaxID=2899220 RepID=UPI001E6399CC|nr:alpha/beta fold hydrolase [Massilia endophytica]UGQ48604.1 alpha/beta hydrolase [Massilia endophytica]